MNYYNEFDSEAAQTLRNLVILGLIPPGDVDERDIREVQADELKGYTQCHFFAGIGGWSRALELAGWPADRSVWTGSCPCPPFSSAGKQKTCEKCGERSPLPHVERTGYFLCAWCGHEWHADERHLWPEFARLIAGGRPAVVFGEQVASADGRTWLDLVQCDLQIMGYAAVGTDICGAGIGAPHIRQRLGFIAERVAYAESTRRGGVGHCPQTQEAPRDGGSAQSSGVFGVGGMANPEGIGHGAGELGDEKSPKRSADCGREDKGMREPGAAGTGGNGGVGDAAAERRQQLKTQPRSLGKGVEPRGGKPVECSKTSGGAVQMGPYDTGRPRPCNGFWGAADWLFCRDGCWRAVEPGTFPLAYGLPVRMGDCDPRTARMAQLAGLNAASLKAARKYRVSALKAYGNAIIPHVFAEMIRAYMEVSGYED